MEIRFTGNNMAEILEQALSFISCVKGVNLSTTERNEPKAPEAEPHTFMAEPIKPVVSMDQAEENMKNAPKHVEPPQPSPEEVRDALTKLRDRKGIAAVKALLEAYGVKKVQELKPEDYLSVFDRANSEV